MATMAYLYLMVLLSSVMTQGHLVSDRGSSCEMASIEFFPLLSDYKPALDYCSSTFPIAHSSVATIFTTTVIVPPNGITTLSETVDGGTVTESGTTLTVVTTSTVTNTDPTTLVATATSVNQRRDAGLVQPEHEKDYGYLSNTNNDGSDDGEVQYGNADDDYDSYDDGYDSSGYGESVDGTWYPALDPEPTDYGGSPDPRPTAAFSRLRALPKASQSSICSCLENHATAHPISTGPLTLSKTATVTSTDEDLPLVATATVSEVLTLVSTTTATDIAVTSTTTTTLFTGPTVTCIANPASNILVNGGFDDYTADEWGEVNPTPWGFDGRGWGPSFFGPRDNAQTDPNYAEFPGDDDGADFRLWQDSTNLDTSLNYTVSFWYQVYSLRPRPYDPDGHGPCPFKATWGSFTIFTKDFVEGDTSKDWKHVNSPIDLSLQSPTVRLELDMRCDPSWLGTGNLIFLLDSIAIYPSNELVCDGD